MNQLENTRALRILHLSTFDSNGGAARAAYRIHKAQAAEGLDSELWVMVRSTEDSSVRQVDGLPLAVRMELARERFREIRYLKAMGRYGFVSLGRTSAGIVDRINEHPADIVQLHWINGMLSVQDIGQLRKPVVWTLHDMWAASGCRHHPEQQGWRKDFAEGSGRLDGWDSEEDLQTWRLKVACWERPFQLVVPSRWMAGEVSASRLMEGWPVEVIPYPLDLSKWVPSDRVASKLALGLDTALPTVAFGAFSGTADPIKGFDLLQQALSQLKKCQRSLQLLIFGGPQSGVEVKQGVRVVHCGHVSSIEALCQIYSAADVLAVPSRKEAFGQVATEAQACGTPVVGFRETGLEDIISHRQTGYLAQPADARDFAAGICWTLGEIEMGRRSNIAGLCRQRAELLWNGHQVARSFSSLYQKILKSER